MTKKTQKLTTEVLLKEATPAQPTEFLELIRCVITLLEKEQKPRQSSKVQGKLLHLKPEGTATIVGDLHGGLLSLTKILSRSGFLEAAQKRQKHYIVFLGDYGDRGLASPEVYYVVLKLKKLYPDKVVLMRGNHEGPEDLLPSPFDLARQFNEKYGDVLGPELLATLRKLFSHLYTAVVIKDRAVLIHGGVPSQAKSLRDLAYAQRRHPKASHLEEMLWNDPDDTLTGTQLSYRGAGKIFGEDVTEKLLKMLHVNILIRGHEFCEEGFKINHRGKVLTLFSTNDFPYGNRHAAYLQFNLSRNVKSASSLRRYIHQFNEGFQPTEEQTLGTL